MKIHCSNATAALGCFLQPASSRTGPKTSPRAEPTISLTRPQAEALAKLIRIQLRSYADAGADSPASDGILDDCEPELFTGTDLDALAPLLGLLETERAE